MKNQIARAEPSRGAPDAAHTPGPWRSSPDDPLVVEAYGKLTIDGSEQKWIATICKHDLPSYECAANARLIAQAPSLLAENEKLRAGHVVLLEALRAIDALIPEPKRSNSVRLPIIAEIQEIVRAAIKQAERT